MYQINESTVVSSEDEIGKKSDVSQFLEFLSRKYTFQCFQSQDGEYFFSINDGVTLRTLKIEERACEDFLIGLIRKSGHRGGRSRDLSKRVKDELCAMAIENGKKEKIFVRAGRTESGLIIDMGGPNFEYVQIKSGEGYTIESNSPIPFYRPSHQSELPTPEGNDIEKFLCFIDELHLKGHGGKFLIAYLVHCLIPDNGACPILMIEGPQGSGKSTTTRYIKRLIDPTIPPIQGMHRSEDDILIAAKKEYLLAYDNQSYISNQLADVFCRISTGAGFSKRMHYSNDELKTFSARIPVIFNGIVELSDRPDLMDRSIVVRLDAKKTDQMISDAAMEKNFFKSYPKVLGGLYQLTAKVLGVLDTIPDKGLARMGDYVRVGMAIDKVLGLLAFKEYYQAYLDERSQLSFENNPFCLAIVKGLEMDGNVEGNVTQIYEHFFRRQKTTYGGGIPRHAKSFRSYLERNKGILEKNQIIFGDLPRSSTSRGMFIKYKRFVKVKRYDHTSDLSDNSSDLLADTYDLTSILGD
jgi:energy-coupling factor transporter ATP-binding protein EcfA2